MLCLLGGATGEQQLWLNSVDRKPSIGREYGAAFRKSGLASPWVNKIEPREPRRQFVDDARRDHSPLAYSQILVCPETFAQRWKPSSQRVFRPAGTGQTSCYSHSFENHRIGPLRCCVVGEHERPGKHARITTELFHAKGPAFAQHLEARARGNELRSMR